MANKTDATNTTGRSAQKPADIPAPGWKAIAKRVKAELKNDHVSLLAAGVAFKLLLALFPGIVAVITVWGLVASPDEITRQVQGFTAALPKGAGQLLTNQMRNVAGARQGTLSVALIISLLVAIWSASGGMAGLIEGCTTAYDEVDERKFPIKRGLAILLTVGAIIFLVIAIGLIAVLPPVLRNVGLGAGAETAMNIGRWPLLALMVIAGLAVLYKYAPDRDRPKLRWVSWGAVIATVLWLVGSALFTLYVNNFGNFGKTYGSFAGIVVLMLWLMLTAFIVLLGAEINGEIERQTAKDTTVGSEQPMGQRGAEPADTTPEDYDSPRT